MINLLDEWTVTRRAVVVSLCLLVLLTGCGCHEERSDVKTQSFATRDIKAISLATIKKIPPPPPLVSNPFIPNQDRRILIDASKSMAGFVRAGGSSSAFFRTLESLALAMPFARIYKYGQITETPPLNYNQLLTETSINEAVGQPRWYDRHYNPDDILISQIAQERTPGVVALVSDGVYSSSDGARLPAVVHAIGQWLSRGGAVSIFVLRSPFSGSYYSEEERRMMPYAGPPVSRPFYVFLFSPDLKTDDELRSSLLAHLQPLQVFTFRSQPVTCTTGLPQMASGSFASEDRETHWSMYRSPFIGAGHKVTATLTISCTQSISIPYDVDLFPTVEGRSLDTPPVAADSHLEPAEATALRVKRGVEVDREATAILVRGAGHATMYSLHWTPRVARVRSDVEQLSALSDLDPGNLAKTYNFHRLIAALGETSLTQAGSRPAVSAYMTIVDE